VTSLDAGKYLVCGLLSVARVDWWFVTDLEVNVISGNQANHIHAAVLHGQSAVLLLCC
jgi:hypothetical protein